jgi:hypothetical protein
MRARCAALLLKNPCSFMAFLPMTTVDEVAVLLAAWAPSPATLGASGNLGGPQNAASQKIASGAGAAERAGEGRP